MVGKRAGLHRTFCDVQRLIYLCNNAKHGFSDLPHFFHPTAPNQNNYPKIEKFYSIFFLRLSSQVQRFMEENFFRRFPAKAFAWSAVKQLCGGIHILLCHLGKRGALGKELT